MADEPRGQGEYVWYIDLYWQRVLSCIVFASFRMTGFLEGDRGSATKRLAPEFSDKGNYGPYLGDVGRQVKLCPSLSGCRGASGVRSLLRQFVSRAFIAYEGFLFPSPLRLGFIRRSWLK